MSKEIIAKKIYQAILSAKKILLVTHYNPDGDALASLSAMMLILKSLGKNHQAFCADETDERFAWLPLIAQVIHDEKRLDLDACDVIISLDCGSLQRTRLAGRLKARRPDQCLIEIDHHQKIEDVADLELRLPEAAATAEVIYDWLKINRLPLTPSLAECLLTGLLTDTGVFVYSATSQKSLAMGAELLSRGAVWPKIVNATRAKYCLAAARLWGVALARLQINPTYQVAWTVLTEEDWQAVGASEEMTEELAGFLSRLGGVKAVLLLKDSADGVVKGSWRSCQDGVDVAKLAARLGGGGHAKAAGFHFNGQLKSTTKGWLVE